VAYGPNKGLGRELWETPLGHVVSGMEHIEQLYSYGDMPPWGQGPVQNRIHNGRHYIDDNFPLIDSFETCTVVRSVLGDSRQAEVAAAVADKDAADRQEQVVRELSSAHSHQQQPLRSARAPVTLSTVKEAAEKRLHIAESDYSDTILAIVLLLAVAAAVYTTRKLFRSRKPSDKTS
jgi:hypothetical protein